MPENKNRQFLDFERPIKDLFDEIEKLKQTSEKTKVDISEYIRKLEDQVLAKRKEITENVSSWQKVQQTGDHHDRYAGCLSGHGSGRKRTGRSDRPQHLRNDQAESACYLCDHRRRRQWWCPGHRRWRQGIHAGKCLVLGNIA